MKSTIYHRNSSLFDKLKAVTGSERGADIVLQWFERAAIEMEGESVPEPQESMAVAGWLSDMAVGWPESIWTAVTRSMAALVDHAAEGLPADEDLKALQKFFSTASHVWCQANLDLYSQAAEDLWLDVERTPEDLLGAGFEPCSIQYLLSGEARN